MAKSAHAAWKYCQKEDTRKEGPWLHGTPPIPRNKPGNAKERWELLKELGPVKALEQGVIRYDNFDKAVNNLQLYHNMTVEVKDLDIGPEELLLHNRWVYGEAGIGKTMWVKNFAKENGLKLYEKSKDTKNGWWTNYRDQEVILLDDIELSDRRLMDDIKQWCQQKPFMIGGKYERERLIRPQYIFFTSNYHPDEIWAGETDKYMAPFKRRVGLQHITQEPEFVTELKNKQQPV